MSWFLIIMIVSIHNFLFIFCQCQLLYIALICKYVAHMGHWPSGLSKNKLVKLVTLQNWLHTASHSHYTCYR